MRRGIIDQVLGGRAWTEVAQPPVPIDLTQPAPAFPAVGDERLESDWRLPLLSAIDIELHFEGVANLLIELGRILVIFRNAR